MRVDPEAVVAPDDVLEDLVVAPIVRRVDDALVLPAAPGVGSGTRERDVEAVGELGQLLPARGHPLRCLPERGAAPGLDLDLGRDQFADEVLVDLAAGRGPLELLEAVRQLERVRIEQRELLLHGDREVLPVVECLAGEPDLFFRAQTLRVAHVASVNEAPAAAC